MFAADGEIEFEPVQTTVTMALADFEVSATLVAVTVTLAGVGGVAGAVYTAEPGPFVAMVPNVEFPPGMPSTLHVTLVEGLPVPVTVAEKTCAAPVARVALGGETLTTMLS